MPAPAEITIGESMGMIWMPPSTSSEFVPFFALNFVAPKPSSTTRSTGLGLKPPATP